MATSFKTEETNGRVKLLVYDSDLRRLAQAIFVVLARITAAQLRRH